MNEGTYGKALALYLQEKLKGRGYNAPFFCCEDWGWWIELKDVPFVFGVCIYCGPEHGELSDLFCTDGATSAKKWSWRKFRFIDTAPWAEKLHADLVSIFQAEFEIHIVSTTLDSPYPEEDDK